VAASVDGLAIRRGLGRREWTPPERFGPDGWWLDRRDGIAGMTLIDLLEALADWRAAGERHADGSMARSLEVNRARFGIGDQLAVILERTAEALGWLDPSPSARLAANPGLVAAIERTVASPSSRSRSGRPERA
jgi:hypothetical protein